MLDFLRKALGLECKNCSKSDVGFFDEATEDFEDESEEQAKRAIAEKNKLPDGFTIEHHVAMDRFYPKYKDHYIDRSNKRLHTVEDHFFDYAEWSDTERGARAIVNEFVAQWKVKVIK